MSETILERVAKLLSLAGNNPSENEAEAAAAKAAAIMREHNISLADVAATQAQNSKVQFEAEHHFMSHNVRDRWKGTLAHIIAEASGGRVVRTQNSHYEIGGFTWFAGDSDSIESMIALYHFLEFQFISFAASSFTKAKDSGEYVPHGREFKNGYYSGLNQGLWERFQQMKPAVETGSGLIVLNDALDRKVREVFGKTVSVRPRKVNGMAYKRGKADAKNLDLNRTKLNRNRPALSA